jgi:hypothetical protein
MNRCRLLFNCLVVAMLMNVVEEGFSQGESERTGCLMEEPRGTFVLVDEVTGQRLTVTGSDLNRYTASGGSRVTVTGNLTRQGDTDVLRVSSVKEIQAACGPIGFSSEGLKEAIGRTRFGVRGGLGLDPALAVVGGQAQLGPVFKGTWFRPTGEFGFGETKVFSLNLDLAYYLPFTGVAANQRGRWNTYFGGGPTITAVDRDDWDNEFGLNFIFGVLRTSGLFLELRAGAYNTPAVRLYVGYVFH